MLPAGPEHDKDLDDAIDNIFNHPNVGPFISKQLIQHLVTSNPSPAYVAGWRRCSTAQAARAGDLRAVVRAILLDPEARGDVKTESNYGRLRHPAQFIANMLRAFGARSADGSGASDGYLNPQSVAMGMDVFRPPSVFSYFSPATGRARHQRRPRTGVRNLLDVDRAGAHNFVNTMVFSRIAAGANAPTGTSIDLTPMQALGRQPASLVDALNALLMHGTMSAEMREQHRGSGGRCPATNPLKRARTAVYLVATSSQYQVER